MSFKLVVLEPPEIIWDHDPKRESKPVGNKKGHWITRMKAIFGAKIL